LRDFVKSLKNQLESRPTFPYLPEKYQKPAFTLFNHTEEEMRNAKAKYLK